MNKGYLGFALVGGAMGMTHIDNIFAVIIRCAFMAGGLILIIPRFNQKRNSGV